MQLLVEEERNPANNAAQVRVTPQELAQATAAIEARQNALAQHEAATIPIGEAVHQLNLEATPEEVLAEVQAQRNARKQTQQTGKTRTTRPAVTIMATVIIVQLAIMTGLGARLITANRKNMSLRYQASADYARIQALEAVAQKTSAAKSFAPVTPESRAIDAQLVKSGKFQTLDIPVGQTLQCKYDTVETLANNADPANIYMAKTPWARPGNCRVRPTDFR